MTVTRLNLPMRFEIREVPITSKALTADWYNYVFVPDVSGMVPISASLQVDSWTESGSLLLSNPHVVPDYQYQVRIMSNKATTISGTLRVLYVSA